ncbi:hypothetical protein, partial [Paenibacillus sp. AR247]|uniref:hypothetical protein n=1 Tax=Paenibacillus sp. AR247 TaxID=1631599 RepID=UPI001C613C2A
MNFLSEMLSAASIGSRQDRTNQPCPYGLEGDNYVWNFITRLGAYTQQLARHSAGYLYVCSLR